MVRLALTDLDRYDLLSDISELSDAQVKQIAARSTEVMDGMPKERRILAALSAWPQPS